MLSIWPASRRQPPCGLACVTKPASLLYRAPGPRASPLLVGVTKPASLLAAPRRRPRRGPQASRVPVVVVKPASLLAAGRRAARGQPLCLCASV